MSWNYIAGDNYNLSHLLELEKFFVSDYVSALNELEKVKKYEKYGLPNWRTVILRRQMGAEEADDNLRKVRKVIEVVKRENK